MSFTDIFLLLIFTVLCGILLALWRIREQLEHIAGGETALGAKAADPAKRPPAA
ncbi:MAG TPA: hypothetical protein VN947_30025 [Polyangia bacterium]|nr:hypothetical protein [Polyangia bacterium]